MYLLSVHCLEPWYAQRHQSEEPVCTCRESYGRIWWISTQFFTQIIVDHIFWWFLVTIYRPSLEIFDKYYICCNFDLYLRYSCLFEWCSLSILLCCFLQIHLYTRIDAPKVSATNPDIWQFAYTRRWVSSYSNPCLVICLHPQFFRQFFAGFENRFSEYHRSSSEHI